jgi:hypothetical protein
MRADLSMLSVLSKYSGIEMLNFPDTVTRSNLTGSGRKNRIKVMREIRMRREKYRANFLKAWL